MARIGKQPDNVSATGATLAARPSLRWAARSVSVVVAVVILIVSVMTTRWLTGAANLSGWVGDPPASPDLKNAVAGLLAEGPCMTASEVQAALPARLQGLGYSDWVIAVGPGVRPDGCVSATLDAVDKRVLLIPGASPELKRTIAEVRAILMDECLGKDEASTLLATKLASLGESALEIRSDGPLAVPLDQKDEVLRHIEAGCYVYSTAGWTSEGVPIYYIAGRPAQMDWLPKE